jgi:hypothetical protein
MAGRSRPNTAIRLIQVKNAESIFIIGINYANLPAFDAPLRFFDC